MKTKIEIGSEFWEAETGFSSRGMKKTYLSGRTALTAIILDLKQKGVKTVSLPDYCCESMIGPFLKQGLGVCFYSVSKGESGLKLNLEETDGCEAVLLVDYFGYMPEEVENAIRYCRAFGKAVILDQTHTVFSENRFHDVDYAFGSFRKWTAVEVGFASGKCAQNLVSWECNDVGRQYLSLRDQGREVKREFVAGGYSNEVQRKKQLALFDRAEEYLDKEYLSDTNEENKRLLASLDHEFICSRRIENAKVIYEFFSQLQVCKPMFSRLPEEIVPLNVPVLLPEEKRDSLRAYLRNCGVFCPVHWPITPMHRGVGEKAMEIYKGELSLVCDQRYDALDIQYMMEKIKLWELTISK